MIRSKDDFKQYILADMKSLGMEYPSIKLRVKTLLSPPPPRIWKFQFMLRECEYEWNCRRKNIWQKIIFKLKYMRLQGYASKLGFEIPLNVCGPGLCICHPGLLVINGNARIGANARIHAGVNIGSFSRFNEHWQPDSAPIIGDNVYIGPGAKLFGKISIGNDVAIGANAVVNKSFPNHVTIAGVPAKIINFNGSKDMIIYGYTDIKIKN